MYRLLAAILLALVAGPSPGLAQSSTIPGWQLARLPQGISQTSPTDEEGRAVVYYQLYVEPYTGSFGTFFKQRVDRIASGMTTVHQRHGTVTEDLALPNGTTRTIWQDVLKATNADGVTAHVMIQGWRVGTSEAQISLVIFHEELNDSHPMVAAALDNVADLWKAGRGIRREAGAASAPTQAAAPPAAQSRPAPSASVAQPQQATAPAAKPCVPKPVRINYPRAVSRQQCGYLGGQYRCSLVTDYVDNYVTVHTGCP